MTPQNQTHTPGPWRVVEAPFPSTAFIKAGRDCADGPVKIAECFSSASYSAIANAALIARAPDLLAENQRLREALEELEAVARCGNPDSLTCQTEFDSAIEKARSALSAH